MNYEQVEKYLSTLINREKSTNIDYPDSLNHFKNFLSLFGNPHKSGKFILIGGTKGKGSTAQIIEKICRTAGHSTGLYLSPHLTCMRERIRINGNPISEERFASLIGELSTVGKNVSVFEILTAAALLLFKRKAVDYSILEVGLGGRLDATNVVEPLISVITSISKDHTNILGNTLKEIAIEKGAIFREEGINISAPQKPSIKNILRGRAGSKVDFIKINEVKSTGRKGTVFTMNGEEYKIGLTGKHQAINASLAITACRKAGINLSPEDLNRTLSDFNIRGRFEIIQEEPTVVFDAAHNTGSMLALKETIDDVFGKSVKIIFSCLSDKDLSGMLRILKPVTEKLYPVKNSSPRSVESAQIEEKAKKLNIDIENIQCKPHELLKTVVERANRRDIIIVTGSFYLLRDIISSMDKY